MSEISHFGLKVGVQPCQEGLIYAEIEVATPLIIWHGLRPTSGRTWRELHIRWWYEISTSKFSWAYEPNGSGGATTLRGCIRKAEEAIEKIIEEMDRQELKALKKVPK